MGRFTDSFKTHLGHATGKAVSDALFKSDYNEKQVETAKKLSEIAAIDKLSGTIEEKIEQLSNISIPREHDELINLLNQLAFLLKSNPIKDSNDEKNKIRNAYSDAILAKFEQAFMTFMSLYPTDSMMQHFQKIFKSAKKLRIIKKNLSIFLLLTFFICAILAAAIASMLK